MSTASQATSTPEFLTPRQIESLTGVKPQTLANWRCMGRGPAFTRMGGVIRYPREAFLKWIERRTVTPSAA